MQRADSRGERGRIQNVGGTSGGLRHFLLGLLMVILGGYWLLSIVTVTSHSWRFFGQDAFGLSLVPLLFGIGWLFFNGRNPIAWLLAAAGAVIIVGGIISSLDIFVRPTNLFNTLIIFVLLVGGLGLIARSIRSL